MVRTYLGLFPSAFTLLKKSNPLVLASSTAFFAVFSLSPIIIILVNVLSLYFSSEEISDELFNTIASTFGSQTADQIQAIVENFRSYANQLWIAIAGFIFLIFIATTLLSIVKLNLNQIWGIRKKPKHKVRYRLIERAKAAAAIILIGLLFVVSLFFDTALTVLHNYLQDLIPSLDSALIWLINVVFSLLVVTLFFMMIYKFLTDADVRWSIASVGGLITALLFNAGKILLSRLLMYSRMETIFGTSASIALILLFIFYTSFIIYYGAAFTFEFARVKGKPIRAGGNAYRFEEKRMEESEKVSKERTKKARQRSSY